MSATTNQRTAAVTVGLVSKEKYNLAGPALKALLEKTRTPFKLLIVDAQMPSSYRRELTDIVRRRPFTEFLTVDRFLHPNQQKNLVFGRSDTDYICFIENDNFISENWLENLLNTVQDRPDCLVTPLIFEGNPKRKRVHFDCGLGRITESPKTGQIKTTRDNSIPERYRWDGVKRIETTESHCFILHRDTGRKIFPLDEILTTREHYDLSLRCFKARIPILLDARVRLAYHLGPTITKAEVPFFLFCWDLESAARTYPHLIKLWNLEGIPEATRFIRQQHYRTSHWKWKLYKLSLSASRIAKTAMRRICRS